MAHFWLGVALMLAPVSAWIAIRGDIVMANPVDLLPALVLGSAVLLWVAGFDMIYACQDFDFDVEACLKSMASGLGIVGALRLAAVCHLGTIILLAILPVVFEPLGWIYGCGTAAVALLLLYEHILVRPDDLTRVNVAFFHVNTIVSIGLFLVGTLDLLT
jgi:4-hydroxybenzoate polyprenyltransferase